jgi:hypothetical protein
VELGLGGCRSGKGRYGSAEGSGRQAGRQGWEGLRKGSFSCCCAGGRLDRQERRKRKGAPGQRDWGRRGGGLAWKTHANFTTASPARHTARTARTARTASTNTTARAGRHTHYS